MVIDLFGEKIQRADSANTTLKALLITLNQTASMATGGNPEIAGTADDVLSSITETGVGLQSIPAQQDKRKWNLQQVSVDQKELVEKDEYLQKWQERFDMEEVLNLSGSRLKK